MTAVLPIGKAAPMAKADNAWRSHLIILAGTGAILVLLFAGDAADMIAIWLESSTYNHIVLIPPIIAWLVWQRLPELRRLSPSAWPAGLIVVAGGAFAWLLGEAGGVALARHLGLIVMLQGLVIACLGKAVARGLAFPIFYALFLVPAGEEIVPIMQGVTAQMCMALLALVGIPAHLEGVFISIPGGYFEVAEACSGVKFLVAMLAYGALVANVCFRSWTRRALFMAAAVAIPVVANGIRAWGTIYVAWHTGSDFAVGFDHVLYGWIFFAIVIALLMGAGWRFFDRGVDDPWFDPAKLQAEDGEPGSKRALAAVAAAALVLAIAPPVWLGALSASAGRASAADVVLPDVTGWQRVPTRGGRAWRPHFAGAESLEVGRYRDDRGRAVDLAIAYFPRQREGQEIVGFGQGAAGPGWAWSGNAVAPPGGRADRITSFGTIREVATFYRVGRIVTGSAIDVKWETMRARLLGGPQRAVAVLVSAQAPADGVSPRPAIDAFLAALGPIDRLADRAAGAS
jgi:exosortase A